MGAPLRAVGEFPDLEYAEGKSESYSKSAATRPMPQMHAKGSDLAHGDGTKSTSSVDSSELLAALTHAREMANHAADLRMRNFNFFVVFSGILFAGLAQLPIAWSPILGVAGAVTSALFVGLDVRGRGLHRRCIDQLAILEPIVWERAGISGWSPIPRHGGAWFLSHNWIYKTFFVMVGLGSILMAAMRIL
jgi:hypothetical protein